MFAPKKIKQANATFSVVLAFFVDNRICNLKQIIPTMKRESLVSITDFSK